MTTENPLDFLVETERHGDDCRGRFRMIARNPKRQMAEAIRIALGRECVHRMAETSCSTCKADFQRALFEVRGEEILLSGAVCINGHFLVSSEDLRAYFKATGRL